MSLAVSFLQKYGNIHIVSTVLVRQLGWKSLVADSFALLMSAVDNI